MSFFFSILVRCDGHMIVFGWIQLRGWKNQRDPSKCRISTSNILTKISSIKKHGIWRHSKWYIVQNVPPLPPVSSTFYIEPSDKNVCITDWWKQGAEKTTVCNTMAYDVRVDAVESPLVSSAMVSSVFYIEQPVQICALLIDENEMEERMACTNTVDQLTCCVFRWLGKY